jgi:hypothetical protein
MVAYLLAGAAPKACLQENEAGAAPVALAVATAKGEVLNALLLGCSGVVGDDSLTAMRQLLSHGAVCDTWAPNGSSALMLAASADSGEAAALLLQHQASVELQDALGRTALMFAAGNDALAALRVLLDAGASVGESCACHFGVGGRVWGRGLGREGGGGGKGEESSEATFVCSTWVALPLCQ